LHGKPREEVFPMMETAKRETTIHPRRSWRNVLKAFGLGLLGAGIVARAALAAEDPSAPPAGLRDAINLIKQGGSPASAGVTRTSNTPVPAPGATANTSDDASAEGTPLYPGDVGTPFGASSAFETAFELPAPPAGRQPLAPVSAMSKLSAMPLDQAVRPAGCSTCGGYHSPADGPLFHGAMGCSGGSCVPGRPECDAFILPCDSYVGALFSNLYQSLCCPDPCYQPAWEPAAYASFFADYARPRTITRIRYDNIQNMTTPDRNFYFLSQTNTKFPGLGKAGPRGGINNFRTDPSVNMQNVYLYQEIGGPGISAFVDTSYRQIDPLFSPTQAGFGDMTVGTKSMLFDREILQVAFQFKTYLQSGNAAIGLGTSHTSLEPSLLSSLKLGPETYFQAQLGNWIPISPSSNKSGGIFFWFFSLNQVLTYVTPRSPLIATLEMDGWSFENGGFTNPYGGPRNHWGPTIFSGGGVSYFNIGPGLRWSICDKVDLGGAVTFPTTGVDHWANQWYRFEVRFLF
jgi:hypothetical protein